MSRKIKWMRCVGKRYYIITSYIFTFLKQFGSSAEIKIVGEQETGTARELKPQDRWHFYVPSVSSSVIENSTPVSSSTLNVDGHVPADGLPGQMAAGVGQARRRRPLLTGGAVEAAAVDGVLRAAPHQVQRLPPRRHSLLGNPAQEHKLINQFDGLKKVQNLHG